MTVKRFMRLASGLEKRVKNGWACSFLSEINANATLLSLSKKV
jgi:hypothetical protein